MTEVTGSYIDQLAAEIRRLSDPEAATQDIDIGLYRLYAVLLLAKGNAVTSEDIHNAWSAWASEHDPTSRHLIPYKELSLSVQQKDEGYAATVRDLAVRLRIDASDEKGGNQ